MARGSAREAQQVFLTRHVSAAVALAKTQRPPLPLSASHRLAAAQFGPGRLGRSDVKFHLSRPFGNVVRVGKLWFGAALNSSSALLFSWSHRTSMEARVRFESMKYCTPEFLFRSVSSSTEKNIPPRYNLIGMNQTNMKKVRCVKLCSKKRGTPNNSVSTP